MLLPESLVTIAYIAAGLLFILSLGGLSAQESARRAALSVISSVQAEIGDRDRIEAWLSVSGFVNAEPGYAKTTAVLNAFSELVVDVFGPEVGRHARTAIGVAALPLNLPVVVGAELQLSALVDLGEQPVVGYTIELFYP